MDKLLQNPWIKSEPFGIFLNPTGVHYDSDMKTGGVFLEKFPGVKCR